MEHIFHPEHYREAALVLVPALTVVKFRLARIRAWIEREGWDVVAEFSRTANPPLRTRVKSHLLTVAALLTGAHR